MLADFVGGFAGRLEETSGRFLFPERFTWRDVTTWDYALAYGYTPAENNTAWDSIKADDAFWLALEAHDDTRSFLFRLFAMTAYLDDVYFITHRMGKRAKPQTETWLRMHGWDGHPTVLLAEHKGMACKTLNAHYYIDDKSSHMEAVRDESPFTEPYLLKRGWNHPVEGVQTVSTLDQYLSAIRTAKAVKGILV